MILALFRCVEGHSGWLWMIPPFSIAISFKLLVAKLFKVSQVFLEDIEQKTKGLDFKCGK